jgi:ABC-type sulfate/molybdate transport systems ATPase subunit
MSDSNIYKPYSATTHLGTCSCGAHGSQSEHDDAAASVETAHDVDEAILLADKIMLMSNGPQARIAEIVRNTMPRTRTRNDMHHDPQFYKIRNHLVDFLVHRSKKIQAETLPAEWLPPVVKPGLDTLAA